MKKEDSKSDVGRPSEQEKKTGRVSIDRSNPAEQAVESGSAVLTSSEKAISKVAPVVRVSSSNVQVKPTRIPSKPTLDATPGWAHPSQKLPNPIHLDLPRTPKKDLTETSVQKIEKLSSNTNLSKTPKGPIEKEPDTKIHIASAEKLSDLNVSKLKKSNVPVDRDLSKGKISVDRGILIGKVSSEVSKTTMDKEQKSKLAVDPIKSKKVSVDKDVAAKVSTEASSEPKRKYFLSEKKRRHSKRSSRKDKLSQDKVDSSAGEITGDVAVAHPDFLDESFLETVDNEPRRESKMSEEYYGGVMKPLRFSSHKKKSAFAFKERVHRKKSGRRGMGVAGIYDWEVNKRLPDDVIPFQYTVYLEPRIESNVFFGRVSIAVDLVLPKSQLWLHVRNLHITSTQLFDQNDNQIPLLGAHKFRKHEFFVIFLEANLRPGIYMINIDYNGMLSDRNHVGLFIRSYKHRDGSKRHLVYTQLGPLYARRVFPCFDEPMFKATYEISIVRPSNDFIAISNMPAENEDEEAPQRGSTTVNYYVTPPISTFHLTMIICDFHNIPVTDPRISFPFNVFIRDDRVENYQKAYKIVLDAIDWFQDYFHVKCPLPKLDLIIMPELTLPSLEGFSVIIIQEDLLNVKDEYEYETLHYILTREVVSQWIGGSVTIYWWNDLWYKEGLTMMLTNLFLDKKYPEQQAIPNFLCYSLQPCMFYDTFITAKKIDKTISDPVDIADCMDPVAFVKAAAIFRMLEQYDPSNFEEGMQRFLSTYHLQNATWKNLSECLNAVTDKNPSNILSVDNMLFNWSQYPGYPLIASALGQKAIAVNQRRFLSTMDSKINNISNYPTWEFPISFVLSRDPTSMQVICMKADSIDTDARTGIPDGVHWYKVNLRQAGFFRVVYQDEEWNTIKKTLLTGPELFTVEDRANFLDDMFSLSRAGYTCYGHTLSTLTYLKYGKENHWLPWACILKHLVFLKNALSSNETDLRNFQNFMTYILTAVLTEEVWTVTDKDEPLKRKLKMAILRLACTMEIPSAKSRLAHLLKLWGFDNKKPKPEPLKFIILRYGAPTNGYTDQQWLNLWKMYQDEKKNLEKNKLLAVLASVANESQMTSLLYNIKTEETAIDDQGFFTVLYEMATTRAGCVRVWDFIKNNWTYITDRFTQSDSRVSLLFPHVAQLFDQDYLVEELEEFSTYEIPTLSTAASFAKNNIYWNGRYRRTVSSWLSNVQKALISAGQMKASHYKHKVDGDKSVPNDRSIVNSKRKIKE